MMTCAAARWLLSQGFEAKTQARHKLWTVCVLNDEHKPQQRLPVEAIACDHSCMSAAHLRATAIVLRLLRRIPQEPAPDSIVFDHVDTTAPISTTRRLACKSTHSGMACFPGRTSGAGLR